MSVARYSEKLQVTVNPIMSERRISDTRETLIKVQTLAQRRSLDIEGKVRMTIARIRTWYEHWEGEVYVSFSGGKDSTVLLDLVWSIYPDVPAVFTNTGLEYPEIVQFVKSIQIKHPERVIVVRPKRTFRDVVLNDGYPVVSKKVSRMLRILKSEKDNPAWANTYRLYDTGVKQDGTYSQVSRLPQKWRPLLDKDWSATELCCDALKKEPLDSYAKSSGRKPITGIMSSEGGQRAKRTECNIYGSSSPSSAPMLFWQESDIWAYIKSRGIEYASIYDNGETRTGCMFCMFGVHLEKGQNRFQRMAKSHPKQHSYCIEKLGMGKVLDDLNVPYLPDEDEL